MLDNELKSEVKKMLRSVPADTMREIIAKSRWTCDSHWMMAMVMNGGWDIANKMNLHVGKTTGKIEMLRLMRDLNIDRPRNDRELLWLMAAAMETFVTKDYFDYEFKIVESGKMVGIVRKCYAFTKVSSIGVDKDYQCGCFGMRAGWYDAMGLDVKERCIKCLKDGADQCEIEIENIKYS